MSSSLETTPTMQERFAEVFAHLPEQDIEQFYAHYQLWVLRHRVPILEKQIEALQEHRAENQQLLQTLQPPSIALAVLARLQSNGVNDVTLLDLMLDRGEDWLDRMMQRLDYCEQVEDFIQGDYNQWCLNSLEGAYDWIDTLRGNQQREETETGHVLNAEEMVNSELTEELLLQKLSFDEDALPATPPGQPATIQTEPPASTDAEITTLEQPAAQNLDEAITLLEQQPAAEESVESAMLALFLDQEEKAETAEETPEQISPAPWYSVNLPEDELLELNQVDWIKMLQQDTVAGLEAGETAVVEYSITEMIEPEEASHASAAATVISDEEKAGLSVEADPVTTSVAEDAPLEQPELLNIIFDETQFAVEGEDKLTEAEAEVSQVVEADIVLEQNQDETETTTVEELESTMLETTPTPELQVSANEDSSAENHTISPDTHESYEELVVVETQSETRTEEIIAEPGEQATLEAAEPVSIDANSESNATHFTDQEFSEMVGNAEETNLVIVDESNSVESLEIVSDETTEISSDTDTRDETTLQKPGSDPLEAVGLYYYTPAAKDQQPAWYDYLEGNPENHSLKQEWQIAPEAQPNALMWENKTDSVAEEQTQPMMLREIKLASETRTEDQETEQAENMLAAEPQGTTSGAGIGAETSLEEQTTPDLSQELSTPLPLAEQQVFTTASAIESVEQTLVVTHSAEELPMAEKQEVVQTTSAAGNTTTFEEETIQIQQSVSSAKVERLEEIRVVTVQSERPQAPPVPTSTNQEPLKKPGFWKRLFRRK